MRVKRIIIPRITSRLCDDDDDDDGDDYDDYDDEWHLSVWKHECFWHLKMIIIQSERSFPRLDLEFDSSS
jgi:hypothetical protein